MTSVHFSSNTEEWATPDELFKDLSWAFGRFTLDPCATKENAKCGIYMTKRDDGLAQSWGQHRVFMNCPYGRGITEKWVKKAWEESEKGATVVCLLPARTDTRWWQTYCTRGYVKFLPGRLKFGDAKNSAPFPSAIVVFGRFFSR